METFTFSGVKVFMAVGIGEVVLGVLLMVGLLRGGRRGTAGRIIGGIVLIVFGSVFASIRNIGEITIDEGVMHINVPFQRDKVIRTSDVVSVRDVRLTHDSDVRPVRKVSGGNVGDVRTGWYKLANGEKAFLAVQGTRALYLETTLGFPVLAGAADFERFEAAFGRHVFAE